MRGPWILLVLAACSRAPTGGLGAGPDADSGARTDLGSADLGMDAGADGGVDLGADAGFDLGPDGGRDGGLPDGGSGNRCADGDPGIQVHLTTPSGDPERLRSLFDQGTVYEVSRDRIRIARSSGGALELQAAGMRTGLDRIRLGERVVFDLDVDRLFWGEDVMIVLSRPAPDQPDDTRVLAVAWSVSRPFNLVIGPGPVTSIDTVDAACSVQDFGCGPLSGDAIRVGGPAASNTVDPGTTRDFGDYVVTNGQSWRFIETPQCTDIPSVQSNGVYVRVFSEDDCEALTRDACIASPDCALHGSTLFDPGYVCRPVAMTCERFDRTGCGAVAGCESDGGQCYCPEGALCACAGGPPPICRELCDLRTDGPLCADRDDYFCETELAGNPGICALGPTGRCVRVPDDCDGTPPGAPACGCPQIDIDPPPEIFDNDCERRAFRASPVPLDACMP